MSEQNLKPEELIGFELMRLTAAVLAQTEIGSDGASPDDVLTVFSDWQDKLSQSEDEGE